MFILNYFYQNILYNIMFFGIKITIEHCRFVEIMYDLLRFDVNCYSK